jgi:hypothetical protein
LHFINSYTTSKALNCNHLTMPIVSVTPENVSNYSHSTVFTTTVDSLTLLNIPPLLSIYTQSPQCIDRWMLAGDEFITTVSVVTYHVPTTLNKRSGGPDTKLNTVWSIRTDPLFTSCQPYSIQPSYSPGVCPDGFTAAEVTEFQANQMTSGVLTSWVASCCKR